MRSNESRFGMSFHQSGKAFQDFDECRERRTGKSPIRMHTNFFPAFVGFIDWVKKSHRVSNVNDNR